MDIREIETEIFGETANPFDRFCDTANASSACCDSEPAYEADGGRDQGHCQLQRAGPRYHQEGLTWKSISSWPNAS